MDDTPSPQADPFRPEENQEVSGPGALAIVALVMGILSLSGSFVAGLGALPAIVGLCTGIAGLLRKRGSKIMAGVGLALSVAGAVVSGLVIWFMYMVATTSVDAYQDMVRIQFEAAKKLEGQPVPPLALTASDGTTFELPRPSGARTIVHLFVPYNVFELSPGAPTINEVYDVRDRTYDVVTFIPLSQTDAERSKIDFAIGTPVFGTADTPGPFGIQDMTGVISLYYVIDENGIVEQVLPGDTESDALIAAVKSNSISNSETDDAP